jgi:hypothetical protein
MRQVPNYGDTRNQSFCVHCGGTPESVDHAPSKVFLDEPFPDNLAASPSCISCNNGFSADETYLSCLLECVMAGSTEPDALARVKIAQIMQKQPKLKDRIEAGRQVVEGVTMWIPERGRVERILVKLARCHVAFEYNEPKLEEPSEVTYMPLHMMTTEQRASFESSLSNSGELAGWPEVGSRAMMRIYAVDGLMHVDEWLDVQEGRYRFRVSQEDGWIAVKFLMRGYLACAVTWD